MLLFRAFFALLIFRRAIYAIFRHYADIFRACFLFRYFAMLLMLLLLRYFSMIRLILMFCRHDFAIIDISCSLLFISPSLICHYAAFDYIDWFIISFRCHSTFFFFFVIFVIFDITIFIDASHLLLTLPWCALMPPPPWCHLFIFRYFMILIIFLMLLSFRCHFDDYFAASPLFRLFFRDIIMLLYFAFHSFYASDFRHFFHCCFFDAFADYYFHLPFISFIIFDCFYFIYYFSLIFSLSIRCHDAIIFAILLFFFFFRYFSLSLFFWFYFRFDIAAFDDYFRFRLFIFADYFAFRRFFCCFSLRLMFRYWYAIFRFRLFSLLTIHAIFAFHDAADYDSWFAIICCHIAAIDYYFDYWCWCYAFRWLFSMPRHFRLFSFRFSLMPYWYFLRIFDFHFFRFSRLSFRPIISFSISDDIDHMMPLWFADAIICWCFAMLIWCYAYDILCWYFADIFIMPWCWSLILCAHFHYADYSFSFRLFYFRLLLSIDAMPLFAFLRCRLSSFAFLHYFIFIFRWFIDAMFTRWYFDYFAMLFTCCCRCCFDAAIRYVSFRFFALIFILIFAFRCHAAAYFRCWCWYYADISLLFMIFFAILPRLFFASPIRWLIMPPDAVFDYFRWSAIIAITFIFHFFFAFDFSLLFSLLHFRYFSPDARRYYAYFLMPYWCFLFDAAYDCCYAAAAFILMLSRYLHTPFAFFFFHAAARYFIDLRVDDTLPFIFLIISLFIFHYFHFISSLFSMPLPPPFAFDALLLFYYFFMLFSPSFFSMLMLIIFFSPLRFSLFCWLCHADFRRWLLMIRFDIFFFSFSIIFLSMLRHFRCWYFSPFRSIISPIFADSFIFADWFIYWLIFFATVFDADAFRFSRFRFLSFFFDWLRFSITLFTLRLWCFRFHDFIVIFIDFATLFSPRFRWFIIVFIISPLMLFSSYFRRHFHFAISSPIFLHFLIITFISLFFWLFSMPYYFRRCHFLLLISLIDVWLFFVYYFSPYYFLLHCRYHYYFHYFSRFCFSSLMMPLIYFILPLPIRCFILMLIFSYYCHSLSPDAAFRLLFSLIMIIRWYFFHWYAYYWCHIIIILLFDDWLSFRHFFSHFFSSSFLHFRHYFLHFRHFITLRCSIFFRLFSFFRHFRFRCAIIFAYFLIFLIHFRLFISPDYFYFIFDIIDADFRFFFHFFALLSFIISADYFSFLMIRLSLICPAFPDYFSRFARCLRFADAFRHADVFATLIICWLISAFSLFWCWCWRLMMPLYFAWCLFRWCWSIIDDFALLLSLILLIFAIFDIFDAAFHIDYAILFSMLSCHFRLCYLILFSLFIFAAAAADADSLLCRLMPAYYFDVIFAMLSIFSCWCYDADIFATIRFSLLFFALLFFHYSLLWCRCSLFIFALFSMIALIMILSLRHVISLSISRRYYFRHYWLQHFDFIFDAAMLRDYFIYLLFLRHYLFSDARFFIFAACFRYLFADAFILICFIFRLLIFDFSFAIIADSSIIFIAILFRCRLFFAAYAFFFHALLFRYFASLLRFRFRFDFHCCRFRFASIILFMLLSIFMPLSLIYTPPFISMLAVLFFFSIIIIFFFRYDDFIDAIAILIFIFRLLFSSMLMLTCDDSWWYFHYLLLPFMPLIIAVADAIPITLSPSFHADAIDIYCRLMLFIHFRHYFDDAILRHYIFSLFLFAFDIFATMMLIRFLWSDYADPLLFRYFRWWLFFAIIWCRCRNYLTIIFAYFDAFMLMLMLMIIFISLIAFLRHAFDYFHWLFISSIFRCRRCWLLRWFSPFSLYYFADDAAISFSIISIISLLSPLLFFCRHWYDIIFRFFATPLSIFSSSIIISFFIDCHIAFFDEPLIFMPAFSIFSLIFAWCYALIFRSFFHYFRWLFFSFSPRSFRALFSLPLFHFSCHAFRLILLLFFAIFTFFDYAYYFRYFRFLPSFRRHAIIYAILIILLFYLIFFTIFIIRSIIAFDAYYAIIPRICFAYCRDAVIAITLLLSRHWWLFHFIIMLPLSIAIAAFTLLFDVFALITLMPLFSFDFLSLRCRRHDSIYYFSILFFLRCWCLLLFFRLFFILMPFAVISPPLYYLRIHFSLFRLLLLLFSCHACHFHFRLLFDYIFAFADYAADYWFRCLLPPLISLPLWCRFIDFRSFRYDYFHFADTDTLIIFAADATLHFDFRCHAIFADYFTPLSLMLFSYFRYLPLLYHIISLFLRLFHYFSIFRWFAAFDYIFDTPLRHTLIFLHYFLLRLFHWYFYFDYLLIIDIFTFCHFQFRLFRYVFISLMISPDFLRLFRFACLIDAMIIFFRLFSHSSLFSFSPHWFFAYFLFDYAFDILMLLPLDAFHFFFWYFSLSISLSADISLFHWLMLFIIFDADYFLSFSHFAIFLHYAFSLLSPSSPFSLISFLLRLFHDAADYFLPFSDYFHAYYFSPRCRFDIFFSLIVFDAFSFSIDYFITIIFMLMPLIFHADTLLFDISRCRVILLPPFDIWCHWWFHFRLFRFAIFIIFHACRHAVSSPLSFDSWYFLIMFSSIAFRFAIFAWYYFIISLFLFIFDFAFRHWRHHFSITLLPAADTLMLCHAIRRYCRRLPALMLLIAIFFRRYFDWYCRLSLLYSDYAVSMPRLYFMRHYFSIIICFRFFDYFHYWFLFHWLFSPMFHYYFFFSTLFFFFFFFFFLPRHYFHFRCSFSDVSIITAAFRLFHWWLLHAIFSLMLLRFYSFFFWYCFISFHLFFFFAYLLMLLLFSLMLRLSDPFDIDAALFAISWYAMSIAFRFSSSFCFFMIFSLLITLISLMFSIFDLRRCWFHFWFFAADYIRNIFIILSGRRLFIADYFLFDAFIFDDFLRWLLISLSSLIIFIRHDYDASRHYWFDYFIISMIIFIDADAIFFRWLFSFFFFDYRLIPFSLSFFFSLIAPFSLMIITLFTADYHFRFIRFRHARHFRRWLFLLSSLRLIDHFSILRLLFHILRFSDLCFHYYHWFSRLIFYFRCFMIIFAAFAVISLIYLFDTLFYWLYFRLFSRLFDAVFRFDSAISIRRPLICFDLPICSFIDYATFFIIIRFIIFIFFSLSPLCWFHWYDYFHYFSIFSPFAALFSASAATPFRWFHIFFRRHFRSLTFSPLISSMPILLYTIFVFFIIISSPIRFLYADYAFIDLSIIFIYFFHWCRLPFSLFRLARWFFLFDIIAFDNAFFRRCDISFDTPDTIDYAIALLFSSLRYIIFRDACFDFASFDVSLLSPWSAKIFRFIDVFARLHFWLFRFSLFRFHFRLFRCFDAYCRRFLFLRLSLIIWLLLSISMPLFFFFFFSIMTPIFRAMAFDYWARRFRCFIDYYHFLFAPFSSSLMLFILMRIFFAAFTTADYFHFRCFAFHAASFLRHFSLMLMPLFWYTLHFAWTITLFISDISFTLIILLFFAFALMLICHYAFFFFFFFFFFSIRYYFHADVWLSAFSPRYWCHFLCHFRLLLSIIFRSLLLYAFSCFFAADIITAYAIFHYWWCWLYWWRHTLRYASSYYYFRCVIIYYDIYYAMIFIRFRCRWLFSRYRRWYFRCFTAITLRHFRLFDAFDDFSFSPCFRYAAVSIILILFSSDRPHCFPPRYRCWWHNRLHD